MDLTAELHAEANRLGAVASGVAEVEPFFDVRETMQSRHRDGTRAGLGFTYRDPSVATDIRATFPWAERLFTVATSYLPDAGSPVIEPGSGRVARFATADHYRPLKAVLGEVALRLGSHGYNAVALHDDHRLVDRAAAVRSGVGWWGLSTMVLTPGYGPWTLLGSVVTDAPLEPSRPMKRTCGTCTACIAACPTGALAAPGVLDARLCLAYVLQAPGVIPIELREAVEDRVYGCDDCLTACPPGVRLVARSSDPVGNVDLLAYLEMDDDSLVAQHPHFYIPARRARYLRRNVLVAVGNWGSERALPSLAAYVGHFDWLLRLHAGWALGRMAGAGATAVLDEAIRTEQNREVLAELQMARAAAVDHGSA